MCQISDDDYFMPASFPANLRSSCASRKVVAGQACEAHFRSEFTSSTVASVCEGVPTRVTVARARFGLSLTNRVFETRVIPSQFWVMYGSSLLVATVPLDSTAGAPL